MTLVTLMSRKMLAVLGDGDLAGQLDAVGFLPVGVSFHDILAGRSGFGIVLAQRQAGGGIDGEQQGVAGFIGNADGAIGFVLRWCDSGRRRSRAEGTTCGRFRS